MKEITFAESLKLPNPLYIDLRTAGEFKEGSIPGAVNIPLFNDKEREELGTIYKKDSSDAAMMRGLEMAAPKLPDLVKKLKNRAESSQPVLFCWRGGLRSRAVVRVVDLVQIPVYQLTGGYKGFRRYVLDYLSTYKLAGPLVTLYGLTGAGKTRILQILQKKGLPALDLEGMAGHRGSVFGDLGLVEAPGQKFFDTALWQTLYCKKDIPFLIIEGESKRLGKVYLPEFLMEAERKRGIKIFVDTPLARRVEHILNEYQQNLVPPELIREAKTALTKIEKRLLQRIGKETLHCLYKFLQQEELEKFVEILLARYYDPLYTKAITAMKPFHLVCDGSYPEVAAATINKYLQSIFSRKELNK